MSQRDSLPRQVARDDRVRVLPGGLHAGRSGTVVDVSDLGLPYPVSVNFDDDYESTYVFKPEELERV